MRIRQLFPLSLLVFALLNPAASHAQSQTGTISGIVTHNGKALPGVNISLSNIRKGTSSDAEGHYTIKQIPEGNYTLRASFVGYRKFTTEVTISAGQTTTVDITMDKTTSQMGEMVVTGTMRKTYVKESPVKVEVVNTEKLTQGKTSANFMDLVGSVNGLSTQLTGGVCGTNAIRINGVEGPNTAVLIDGLPIMGALCMASTVSVLRLSTR